MIDPTSGRVSGRIARLPDHVPVCPWPEDAYVQGGGNGIVFVDGGKNYRTVFVEAFPPNGFVRGEGSTPEEAERKCWAAWERSITCSVNADGEHTFTPYRGKTRYRNGAGFCSGCGAFRSGVFTAEELDQRCSVCGVFTMSDYETDKVTGDVRFFCTEHPRDRDDEFMTLFGRTPEQIADAMKETP